MLVNCYELRVHCIDIAQKLYCEAVNAYEMRVSDNDLFGHANEMTILDICVTIHYNGMAVHAIEMSVNCNEM